MTAPTDAHQITCHLPEYQIARDQTATFSDSILTLLTGSFHRYPATSVAPFLILWTRSLRSEREKQPFHRETRLMNEQDLYPGMTRNPKRLISVLFLIHTMLIPCGLFYSLSNSGLLLPLILNRLNDMHRSAAMFL